MTAGAVDMDLCRGEGQTSDREHVCLRGPEDVWTGFSARRQPSVLAGCLAFERTAGELRSAQWHCAQRPSLGPVPDHTLRAAAQDCAGRNQTRGPWECPGPWWIAGSHVSSEAEAGGVVGQLGLLCVPVLLCLAGNLLTLLAFRRQKAEGTRPYVHQYSLVASDLVMCLCGALYAAEQVTHPLLRFSLNTAFCDSLALFTARKWMPSLAMCAYLANAFLLTACSLDRIDSMTKPLAYKVRRAGRRAVGMNLGSYGLAALATFALVPDWTVQRLYPSDRDGACCLRLFHTSGRKYAVWYDADKGPMQLPSSYVIPMGCSFAIRRGAASLRVLFAGLQLGALAGLVAANVRLARVYRSVKLTSDKTRRNAWDQNKSTAMTDPRVLNGVLLASTALLVVQISLSAFGTVAVQLDPRKLDRLLGAFLGGFVRWARSFVPYTDAATILIGAAQIASTSLFYFVLSRAFRQSVFKVLGFVPKSDPTQPLSTVQ